MNTRMDAAAVNTIDYLLREVTRLKWSATGQSPENPQQLLANIHQTVLQLSLAYGDERPAQIATSNGRYIR